MFLFGLVAVAPIDSAAPVPTEISNRFFSPFVQFNLYAGSVAIRYNKNAGLLYGVIPPSTKTVAFEGSLAFQDITPAGKYTGAAVLARTSFHNGIFRLQSIRVGALYFASGLLLTGHTESVVTFFVTTKKEDTLSSLARAWSWGQIHSATA